MKSSSSRVMAAAMTITSLLILCSGVASGTTVTVTVGNGGFFFTPSSVTIHPGDTVKWTWSSTGHSSTSGTPGHPNGLWDSGVLAQGAMFTHTFNTAGSFPYYCTPHGACCGMVGTVTVSNTTPTPTPTPPPPPGPGTAIVADFNGDGHQDFVVRNSATRQTAIWYLNNNVFISGVFGPTLPAGWGLRGAADFNSDSHPDYGFFNSATRQTAIWYLSGPTFIGSALGPTPPSGWALVATADFNGNGKPDYVLYNATTRQTAIWYLNNNVFVSAAFGPTLPAGWGLSGVADFDGDGHPDYALFNSATRQTSIWYLSGSTFIRGVFGPTSPSGWALVAAADFNGNGKPDYLLYNAATRQTAIWYLNNNVFVKLLGILIALPGSALITVSGGQSGSVEKWMAPAAEARKKNPVAVSESSLTTGQKIYVKRCVACHGKTGNGDGPDAADLGIHPAKLSDSVIREETDGELFWKITVGKKPMPNYGTRLSPTDRWNVINYLRSLARR